MSVKGEFGIGDKVLVLLPIPGSPLQAKFSGPYVVQEKLSETDYVVGTPDRRRKSRVCHINMMKPYFSLVCDSSDAPSSPAVVAVSAATSMPPSEYFPECDGF